MVFLLFEIEMGSRSWRRSRIQLDRAGSWKSSLIRCGSVKGTQAGFIIDACDIYHLLM